jgi:Relaxase/Mobilisation nuclease domain
MIVKILKGRSFSGLLDYLFTPQDKPPPREIEARGSPDNQRVSEEQSLPKSRNRETDRAGSSKEMSPGDSTGNQQRGNRDRSGVARHEQRGELLITNMAGRSKEELREHFEALAALRPDVEVNVLHGILSMPEEDELSRETKVRIVLRFVELKGLDRTMFAAIEHKEEGHNHTEIHIASSTIDFKGRLPSDSFDYDKSEAIARQLEKEFNLKPNKSSRNSMERAPTQGEWKQHERTGKLSRPLRLQALVNSALDREITFTEFQRRLNRKGVELRLIINDDGKAVGSVYEFEGEFIRGRRLGRGFTWQGLQKEWPDQQERKGRIDYDSTRDYAAFSRSRSSAMGRGGAGESGEPERLVGAISGDGAENQRAKREARADRNQTHQTPAISEASRGAVRYNRPRGKGVARGDSRAPEDYNNESQSIQRTGNDDRRPNQGRVSVPTPDSSAILRRDSEDQRSKQADGWAMSRHGGDKQRGLSQGQRGSAGNLGKDTGTSQGHSRGASQRDRGAGPPLQNSVQASGQMDHHRNNNNSPERARRGNNGRSNDGKIHTASGAGPEQPDSIKVAGPYQKPDSQLGTRNDAQSSNNLKENHQPSAVDVVLQKLWGSSSCEAPTDQSTSERKELLASKRSLQMIDKDRDEPSLSRNITQEKLKRIEQKDQGRSSSNNRGR